MRRIVAFELLIILFLSNFLYAKESLLIFSGDIRGEIKPCGCAEEGDMGGLPRRHTFFKQQKSKYKKKLFYFDLGNNFPEPSEQGNLKINLIQSALKKLSPEAVLVGPNEWLNGLNRLDLKIPYLLSNQGENLNFLQLKTFKNKEKTIIIYGYLSPDLIYQNENDLPLIIDVNNKLISDWRKNLQSQLYEKRILLFRGNSKELQKFDDSGLFDLIIAGSNNDDELNQILKMETKTGIYPMIPTKGQGVLTGEMNGQGMFINSDNGIVPSGLSLTWLRRNFEDAIELDEMFKEYNSAVKEMFFSNLDRMEKQRNESLFVGDGVCIGCHQNSVKVWKDSRHSNAFLTLENKKKHFDPECLECHVVGLKPWKRPHESMRSEFEGAIGFLSPQITPHLMNVQCENCHGPSRAHLANSKIHPPTQNPKSTCVNCHHGSHSPLFEFDTYWRKIKH